MSTALLLRRAALVVSLGLSLSLAPRMAFAAGNTYSDAPLISSGQFFGELKEVALTLAVDLWITKYVPEAELRTDVTNALARYGITVRSNAPVSLLVTLDQISATIRKTIIYSRGPNTMEDYRTHLFHYTMAFFVRAAALRDGKFHVLMASPTSTSWTFIVEENNEVRRLIIGDELRRDIEEQLAAVIPLVLKDIASKTTLDTTPWAVNGWTGKQKAAANAAYTAIMNTDSVEKQPIDGLNSVPTLELTSEAKDEACVVDPSWRKFWQAEFQRLGLVKTQGESALTLYHHFRCTLAGKYSFPNYFPLLDDIDLAESNLVFELNGHLVRKPAYVFSSHRMLIALGDELAATLQGYLPRSITEFVTNLTLGNLQAPAVAGRPPAAGITAPGPVPKTAPRPAANSDDPLGPGGYITPYRP